jgi:sec-independent protein translocase protein TatA
MSMAFFPGQVGPFELLVVLFVILLMFGGKKLPGLARSLGRSLSEFKKGREDGLRMVGDELESESPDSGEGKPGEIGPSKDKTNA